MASPPEVMDAAPATGAAATADAARLASLRLAFVTGRLVSVRADGSLWADPGLGRLVDELARRVARLELVASSAPQARAADTHRLEARNLTLEPLPFMPSYARGLYRHAACQRAIRQAESRADAAIVQLPFTAPTALLGPRGPRVYQLCADVVALVRSSRYYTGLRRLPARLAAGLIDRVQQRLLRGPRVRAVAHGADLHARYGSPPGRIAVSTSLWAREVGSVGRARAADAPFRVLFVGYLRPEKGIDTLLEAFEQLRRQIPDAELAVVGAAAIVERDLGPIDARLAHLADERALVRLGEQPFGHALFQCYADADVTVVASRSEGTPRVLVEARAFGCPVVATRVGGVPTSVADGVDGLLVPPDDPAALADALLRLARDAALRARLVEAGYARARQTTVERFAADLLEEVLTAAAPA